MTQYLFERNNCSIVPTHVDNNGNSAPPTQADNRGKLDIFAWRRKVDQIYT